ncbi:MAG TPA: hypothetical protein DDW65_20915 [Firmicutes bacterium]|jgi:glycosyltransferase AglD|nr:hypothetical protein [Bacillota bacterium]
MLQLLKKIISAKNGRNIFPRWYRLVFYSVLFSLALGMRIPWLWEIPRYVDELKEVNLARLIYLGKLYPLHNMAREIGAFHNYILAGIFKIFGLSLAWPRLYVAIISALTVVLIYELGRRLYNRSTGLIAAGLLLTNGMHILVTHTAWSNCTTPFFFILGFMTVLTAEQNRNGKGLIIAGFVWALALQTHSSVIIYLVVIIGYVLRMYRSGDSDSDSDSDSKIETKYYIYAGLAFITGYANMIYYNTLSRGGSIAWIFSKDYTLETNPGWNSFLKNLHSMFFEVIRSLSAVYASRGPLLGEYLAQPLFAACIFILGLGIVRAVKKRQWLLLWLIGAGFMVIPWINRRYGFFMVTRYIMPVIICSILLLADGLYALYELISAKLGRPRLAVIVGVSLFLGFTGFQLGQFYYYCAKLSDTDMSNRLAIRIVRIIAKWDPVSNTKVIDRLEGYLGK